MQWPHYCDRFVVLIFHTQGRLEPGKIFLVDIKEKRVVHDAELKQKLAQARNYQEWLKEEQIGWQHLGVPPSEVSAPFS